MPDPHVLYVVTAVVVLGLVAWVIVVLARAPVLPQAPAKGADDEKAPAPTPPAKSEPAEPERTEPAQPSKPHLDAHLEIQDEKDGADKPRNA
jgi:hypothetical protein